MGWKGEKSVKMWITKEKEKKKEGSEEVSFYAARSVAVVWIEIIPEPGEKGTDSFRKREWVQESESNITSHDKGS